MMLRDWSDAVEGVGKPQAEELKLEHEEAEAGGEKPWIDEAIQLFGEDLVVIKTSTSLRAPYYKRDES